MLHRLFIGALCLAGLVIYTNGVARAARPLTLTQSVPISQLSGGTNHLAADVKRQRFFVTAPGDKKVVVVNLHAGNVFKVMEGVPAAAALFLPDLDELCVSGGGAVAFYEGDSLAPLGKVELHASVDELRYDSRAKRVYVGVTDAKEPGIAVIDAVGRKLLHRIKLPVKPQGFVLEEHGPRLYANTPAAKQVTVVDRDRGVVVDEWRLAQDQGNYPIALDESAHHLFVGCRRPAEVIVLDSGSGKRIASVFSGGDADDMSFDPKTTRIYLACGEGVISTVREIDGTHYERLEDTPTADGARNSLFVPELSTLFVAIPKQANGPAELRAYRAHD